MVLLIQLQLAKFRYRRMACAILTKIPCCTAFWNRIVFGKRGTDSQGLGVFLGFYQNAQILRRMGLQKLNQLLGNACAGRADQFPVGIERVGQSSQRKGVPGGIMLGLTGYKLKLPICRVLPAWLAGEGGETA